MNGEAICCPEEDWEKNKFVGENESGDHLEHVKYEMLVSHPCGISSMHKSRAQKRHLH